MKYLFFLIISLNSNPDKQKKAPDEFLRCITDINKKTISFTEEKITVNSDGINNCLNAFFEDYLSEWNVEKRDRLKKDLLLPLDEIIKFERKEKLNKILEKEKEDLNEILKKKFNITISSTHLKSINKAIKERDEGKLKRLYSIIISNATKNFEEDKTIDTQIKEKLNKICENEIFKKKIGKRNEFENKILSDDDCKEIIKTIKSKNKNQKKLIVLYKKAINKTSKIQTEEDSIDIEETTKKSALNGNSLIAALTGGLILMRKIK